MTVPKRFHKRKIFYSIFIPPLAFAPVGLPLFLFGINVSIIRDAWYFSIFVCCVILTLRDRIPLSQIGLSKQKLGLSLLLAGAWEMVTFFSLGVIPFFAITGRLPILVPFNEAMIYSAFHFMLVGLAEETWMRGLLLRRIKEWRPKGLAPVMWSSMIFVSYHMPANSLIVIQDVSLIPLIALSMLTLFVWAAGLAAITLKTGNLLGPITVHGLDDFVSKVLFPLQI
jgi:membrane protease YdiL (CAAX protease family)